MSKSDEKARILWKKIKKAKIDIAFFSEEWYK